MDFSQGILTVFGGMTSHAAVVARGMGRAAVVGCGALKIDEEAKTLTVGDKVYHEGDFISLDGSTGNVYDGQIATVEASISGEFARFMGWADAARRLRVRTNADTPARHQAGCQVRCGRYRPVPYRAHVLRGGSYRGCP